MKKLFLLLLLLIITTTVFCQVVKLKKHYYTIYFHEKQKAPLYTVYILKKAYITNNPRHGSFKQDTALQNDKQASDLVYDSPEYDKGHLTPDADFRFNDTAEEETFLYTNAAPQQEYFNEHLWANVEKHVRDVCLQHGDVKVYTGCLYSSKKLNSIGIPGYFWKVIVYKNNNRTTKEAFLGKNKKSGSNNYLSIAVKLVNIEKRTGLHF